MPNAFERSAEDLTREGAFAAYLQTYPFTLVDVGAAGGIVREWGALGPHTRVVAVEPNSEELGKIQPRRLAGNPKIRWLRDFLRMLLRRRHSENTHYFNKLLGESARDEVDFYLFHSASNSSVYPPNVEVLRRFGKVESWGVRDHIRFPQDTLDGQLDQNGLDDVDFIKLDTQGSELSILKGGKKATKEAAGVMLEVEFLSLYKNQSLFGDVDVYLRSQGFDLVEIIRTKYWKAPFDGRFLQSRGQIAYGDVLYLKNPAALAASLTNMETECARAKAIKAAALCTLYGHPDHGYEIVRAANESGVFDTNEARRLEAFFSSRKLFRMNILGRLPDFPGKAALGRICYVFYNFLKSRDRRWMNGVIWK